MNKLEDYRSSTDYREILRILQKASTEKANYLWQSHALNKTIFPIQFIEIDFISREVLVNFNSNNRPIDSQLPLYVKLDHRSSVFKVNHFRQNQASITFSLPEMIKTLELRTYPRHLFKPAQDKFVTLRSSSRTSAKESGSELKVRVMDISERGLGLVISEKNGIFLKNNRILKITGLHDDSLYEPISAEVIYVNSEVDPRFLIKKQKSLKVGLKVSTSFPDKNYERFLL